MGAGRRGGRAAPGGGHEPHLAPSGRRRAHQGRRHGSDVPAERGAGPRSREDGRIRADRGAAQSRRPPVHDRGPVGACGIVAPVQRSFAQRVARGIRMDGNRAPRDLDGRLRRSADRCSIGGARRCEGRPERGRSGPGTAGARAVRRAVPLALLVAAGAAHADVHRFALVVGDSQGGAGTRPLRYAERDAKRIHAILTRLGGVREEDARLLTGVDADDMRGALRDLGARAAGARNRGEETLLLVYFSGHAKDGELRLRDTRLPLSELRSQLNDAPADVRIGFLDSCQSGAITRMKGVRAAPAFDVQRAREAGPRGLVLIASSASDEESQESDEIAGSFFTHYLASRLLGDADASGDGKVTLAEAYAYAYGRTVGSTAETRAGAQHPVYLYDLGGAGDVVLTELSPARGGLLFGAADEGVYVVLDGQRRAVAEVAKAAGSSRRLALAPGNYIVKKRLEDAVLVGDVKIANDVIEVADARLVRKRLEDDPQKGASGPRWSLLGTGGYQVFFDSAARNGLFPPAALGG